RHRPRRAPPGRRHGPGPGRRRRPGHPLPARRTRRRLPGPHRPPHRHRPGAVMTAETAARPRPPLRAWTALIGAETRSVVRDTAGLLIPLGMPLLILVMNGVTNRGGGEIHGVPIFERSEEHTSELQSRE